MDGTAAARLLDWEAAARIGGRLAGPGPRVESASRALIREDFAELVPEAERLVTGFTGLALDQPTRPWVMSRAEWVRRNLRGFERVLEPFADRLTPANAGLASIRRKVLGAQVGGFLGYLGRKVLGQYDLFVEPEDRDLLYFVGPNVLELEARYRFSPRDFRLWLCLHEVAHRVQFGGVPWLRGQLHGLVDSYLESIDLDSRKLLQAVRRAADEARRDREGSWRGLGFLFLLMTPEQRDLFRRMQALMALLEGHGNYVMDSLSPGNVRGGERMRRTLHMRRHGRPVDRMVQKALGLDAKIRQYDIGERFVAAAVERAGMDGFNRVWTSPETLPTLEEIAEPDAWVERVAG